MTIATPHRTSPARCVVDEAVFPSGQVAREVADHYMRSLTAQWQGEPGRLALELWLTTFWSQALPVRPEWPADAVSPHGGGGRGIHWYETVTEVVGYVPGISAGYRIPLEAVRTGSTEDADIPGSLQGAIAGAEFGHAGLE